MNSPLARMKNGLIISCQADAGTPTDSTPMIVAFAQSAQMGGAVGLRLNGPTHTAAVRTITDLPIIAIEKVYPPNEHVLITGDAAHVPPLIEAGADIIALDVSDRPRPSTLPALIEAIHSGGALAMADLRTFDEAAHAVALGVDVLATTLAVFDLPPYTPDIDLIRRLAESYDVPIIAEGNFWRPEDIARALDAGAHAVVVGSAVTRPWKITEYLAHAIRR